MNKRYPRKETQEECFGPKEQPLQGFQVREKGDSNKGKKLGVGEG